MRLSISVRNELPVQLTVMYSFIGNVK